MVKITIYLPKAQKERLRAYCQGKGFQQAETVRRALDKFLDKQELRKKGGEEK